MEETRHAFCRHRVWPLHFVGDRTSGFLGGSLKIEPALEKISRIYVFESFNQVSCDTCSMHLFAGFPHCSSFRVYGSLRLLTCPSQSRPMQTKRFLDGMMPLRLERHLGWREVQDSCKMVTIFIFWISVASVASFRWQKDTISWFGQVFQRSLTSFLHVWLFGLEHAQADTSGRWEATWFGRRGYCFSAEGSVLDDREVAWDVWIWFDRGGRDRTCIL